MSEPEIEYERTLPEPLPPGTDTDREALLAKHYELGRLIEQTEQERQAIRDQLAADGSSLMLTGPQYFIDNDGNKRYGFRVAPEKVDVNPAIMLAVGDEVLEDIAPRKIDTRRLKRAVEAGRIPADLFAKYTRIVPGTPHIRYGDPVE